MSQHASLWCVLFLASCAAAPTADKPSVDTPDQTHAPAVNVPSASNGKERDVYQKRLDAEREVVVVQGSSVAPQVLRGPISQRTSLDQCSTVYAVRVELRSQGQPPLVLASCLLTEGLSDEDKGFDVLDALIEPGKITFAMTQRYCPLLWQFDPLSQSSLALTSLRPGDWSPFNACYRRDRNNIGISLRRDGDGKLTIEVVDRLPPSKEKHQMYQHTLFEQVEDVWKFKTVKKWWAADGEKE